MSQVKRKSTKTDEVHPIRPNEFYKLSDFLIMVGWGDDAWRRHQRKGLKGFPVGRQTFVDSNDFIAYLRKLKSKEEPKTSEESKPETEPVQA